VNFKRIGLLMGVLIVLIVAILIVNQSEKQKGEIEGKLINLNQEKVIRLELLNKGRIIIFQKQNRIWNIESPVKTRANNEAVEDILDNFSTLIYERIVEKEAGDLAKYGLARPEIQLKLYERKTGTPVYIIQMGIKNPLDSSSYTKLSTNNKIVLTAAYKRDHLEKDLFDFRDKRFIDFESLDVSAFDFKFNGEKVTFKKKKNSWFLEYPLFSLAQDSQVEDIIHNTSQLEARSFRGKSSFEQLKKFGFQTPLLELKLKLKNEKKTLKVVQQNDRYFAYSPDFEEICEIEKNYIEHFNKKLSDFREHKIARFYSFDVREIEYRDRFLHFLIQKSVQGTWGWVKPVLAETINENKVNDLLSAIEELEAESFIDKPSGQEKFLYFFKIKIKNEESGENGQTIKISLSNKNENLVVARNADLPYLFGISPDIINKLPEKIDQFFQKDKKEQSFK